jgi:Pumilio-family RNA binding repeat
MEGIACNQDYEELEVLLSEMPKTPSDSSIQGTTNSSYCNADFQTDGKYLPAINLPDEESLATAFADMSFREQIGSTSSSSRAPLRDPSFGGAYGGVIYNSSTPCNIFPSYNPLIKSNPSLHERSKLQNLPVYMYNVPVSSSNTRRLTEVPVSASPLVDHLYNPQYPQMSQSGMTLDELQRKIHSRNLQGLQNLRQPGFSVCERYWRNTQLSSDCQSTYPDGYNSELLIGRGEPCRLQYGEGLRHPLFNQAFSAMTTQRTHGVCPHQIVNLAKDQKRCQLLQNVLKEENPSDIAEVFDEIIGNIADLMIDPFGNYLVQMFLERCNETQKALVVYQITRVPGQLLRIACDIHG